VNGDSFDIIDFGISIGGGIVAGYVGGAGLLATDLKAMIPIIKYTVLPKAAGSLVNPLIRSTLVGAMTAVAQTTVKLVRTSILNNE